MPAGFAIYVMMTVNQHFKCISQTAIDCRALWGAELTGCQDIVDKLLQADSSVLVPVNCPEDVQDARFQVADPLHVAFAPHIEVKIGKLLHLWRNRYDNIGKE